MNAYQHEGDTFAVIGGEIYVRLRPAGWQLDDAPNNEMKPTVKAVDGHRPKRRGRPPGRPRKSTVGARVKTFQCMKGHRFQATLEQSKALCPQCRSKAFREISEPAVKEEAGESAGILEKF